MSQPISTSRPPAVPSGFGLLADDEPTPAPSQQTHVIEHQTPPHNALLHDHPTTGPSDLRRMPTDSAAHSVSLLEDLPLPFTEEPTQFIRLPAPAAPAAPAARPAFPPPPARQEYGRARAVPQPVAPPAPAGPEQATSWVHIPTAAAALAREEGSQAKTANGTTWSPLRLVLLAVLLGVSTLVTWGLWIRSPRPETSAGTPSGSLRDKTLDAVVSALRRDRLDEARTLLRQQRDGGDPVLKALLDSLERQPTPTR